MNLSKSNIAHILPLFTTFRDERVMLVSYPFVAGCRMSLKCFYIFSHGEKYPGRPYQLYKSRYNSSQFVVIMLFFCFGDEKVLKY